MSYEGNIGSLGMKEVVVLVGPGPHIVLNEKMAGQAELPAGALMALDADDSAVPFDVAQDKEVGTGDGTEKSVSGNLGKVVPDSVSITDGTETFTDDGFGGLVGDATGTGKINYETGDFEVTFNAAPANAQAITATYKPALRGVLTAKADAEANEASICVHGKVNRAALTVSGSAATIAHIRTLYALAIWPLG